MELEITPTPTEAEQAAIEAAIVALRRGSTDDSWWGEGLAEAVDADDEP